MKWKVLFSILCTATFRFILCKEKSIGQPVAAGEGIASFGPPAENGNWPSHLHFQVIENMEGMAGDYPGVCRVSERDKYLCNCPDANLLLNLDSVRGAG